MCRADIAPEAQPALAAVLRDMARELARLTNTHPEDVRIGPVDFGPEPEENHDHA